MNKTLLLLLTTTLVLTVQTLSAQAEFFTYEDEEQTIIDGIKPDAAVIAAINEEGLTIPASVKKVNHNAFYYVSQLYSLALQDLVIDGGNPEFELSEDNKNALADVNNTLTTIKIQGTAMTTENIGMLLTGLDNTEGTLAKLEIYNPEFPLEASITSEEIEANTTGVRVVLPAARVSDNQQFGNAVVYGRFSLSSEIVSFCGHALFYDENDGSQFLFYVPTELNENNGENKIYVQRVKYIQPYEGVLLHNIASSSEQVELPHIHADQVDETPQYITDDNLYKKNMLRGTTQPTTITPTEEKNGVTYTNMILYNGLFYATSGGTLGANRAYLQVPKSALAGATRLSMFVVEDETTGVLPTHPSSYPHSSLPATYDLQGRKINAHSLAPHNIYIQDGKKMLIR